MIPRAAIVEWSRTAPWPSEDQVEQDLLLSRLIVEVANHSLLGRELAFRGGTCLHKLYLSRPYRYSEDLDYVRRTASGVGPVFDAIREIADGIGLVANTAVGVQPKVLLRGAFESGRPFRIKIEMNTFDRVPPHALAQIPFEVRSHWYQGEADILTFEPHGLIATKLRALYQRSKGRDLFDLWLALSEMKLDGREIARAFEPYRPEGYTARLGEQNLRLKLEDDGFRDDLRQLVIDWPTGYDVDGAGESVVGEILRHL